MRERRCTCRPMAPGPRHREDAAMTRLLRATPGHAAPVIVAPLDGSAPGRGTTALAAGLIRRMGWRLALVPVPLRATAADRRRRLIAGALDERAALIASPATHHESAAGKAADCLALAACAPCPVLAVPLAGDTEPALDGPVICGIDGTDGSAPVARAAAGLAVALGAALELVHVAAPRENGAASLRRPPHAVHWTPMAHASLTRHHPSRRGGRRVGRPGRAALCARREQAWAPGDRGARRWRHRRRRPSRGDNSHRVARTCRRRLFERHRHRDG